MKTKKLLFLPLLALFISSCSFDMDDEGLSRWLSDQGMPSSYKVQTVTVSNLKPISAEVFKDTLPLYAYTRGVLGASAGMAFDAVFDFAIDSAFTARLKKPDSVKSNLILRMVDSYYKSSYLPSGYLPIEEDLKLNVSWILSDKMSQKEWNKLEDVDDSVWMHELESWKTKKKADTTISVSVGRNDSLVLDLPSALISDIRKNAGYRRLQLRLSAPEASNIYRFYGPGIYFPRFHIEDRGGNGDYVTYNAYRSASLPRNLETCSDCLILHSGVFDSLVVEFPSEPIMKALSDFYGDEFPYTLGDSNDVRQAVVMAEVSFYKDDSKGTQEMDMPIQVIAGSFMDSADAVVRRIENYKLNRPRVLKSGHPNVVFYDGDTLSLQVTAGLRDFINKASDGRSFKMMMRLGYPVLLDKDTVFYDRISNEKDTLHLSNGNTLTVDQGDTVRVLFSHFDYARYDFTSIKNKPATLKLWLASKRGQEMDKKETVKKDSTASAKIEGKTVATSTAREGK